MIFIPSKEPDLTLFVPMPPSVNKMYANAGIVTVRGKSRSRGRVKTKEYHAWIAHAQAVMYGQPYKYYDQPIAVRYSMEVKDKRIRDCANYEKALSDFLTRARIIKDDCLIRENVQCWADEDKTLKGVKIEIFLLTP